MKLDKRDFDTKALDVGYEKSTFKRYTGDVPRSGTILKARVNKMWWTQSGDGTSQIFLMAFAEGNTGDRKQYNGLPIKEYLTFKPEASFRYMPFLENFGLKLEDIRLKMMVEEEPDNIGDIITSIADWVVGSDDALCRIVIFRDRYQDEYNAKVDREGWLPYDEADEADDNDEDDDEDDEPPARPTRVARSGNGARSTSRSAGTRASRRQEPEPEDDDEDDDEPDDDEDNEDDYEVDEADDDEEDEAEEEPPARPARRGATTRAASSRQSARSSARQPAREPARSGGSRREASGSTRVGSRGTAARGSSGRANEAAARDRQGRGSNEDPPF
jgi:hypothetical protein